MPSLVTSQGSPALRPLPRLMAYMQSQGAIKPEEPARTFSMNIACSLFSHVRRRITNIPQSVRLLISLMAMPVLASPIELPNYQPIIRSNAIGSSMGVSIHGLNNIPLELDQIAASGSHYVRMDVTWGIVERVKGVYDWSSYDPLVQAIAAHGMRPMLVLAYSNSAYASTLPARAGAAPTIRAPFNASSRSGYARFAAAAASRFKQFDPVLEIWNEPNADRFWPPKASPAEYLVLAEQACAAIRRAVPNADVIAPGFGNDARTPALDSPFLVGLSHSPLVQCVTAISVHPYLFMSALDTTPRWWSELRSTLGPAKNKQLVASEWGLSTFSNRLSDLDQASYLVRMAVYDAAAGVRSTIWYDWRDDGNNPDEVEDHFGLVRSDGKLKPAYVAMKRLINNTRPFSGLCLWRDNAEVRVMFFSDNDFRRLLVWNVGSAGRTPPAETQPVLVRLPAGAKVFQVTDLLGRPAVATLSGKRVQITGGEPPFYIDYDGANISGCDSAGA